MKRFTETEKWRDPWFQKLDTQSRTLWLWLCDRVDNAGVVDICWPICNAETNGVYSEDSMNALGSRVEKLETGKWWIPGFVHFQFGDLSENCKPHAYIIKLLKKHSLSNRVPYRVSHTFKEKEQEQEQEKDKEKEGGPKSLSYSKKGEFKVPSLIEVKHQFMMLELPESDAQAFFDNYEAKGWMMGSSPMNNLAAACRTWKTNMKKFQNGSFSKPKAQLRKLQDL